jgi:hypothetical protein
LIRLFCNDVRRKPWRPAELHAASAFCSAALPLPATILGMTDEEILEKVRERLRDLAALCEHLRKRKEFGNIFQAKAFELDKIAEIVGIKIEG